MNSHNVPPTHPEPLTPDERVWAERLSRIGPHDGPSPALDAKILAAAHAAVAPRPRPQRRRSPPLRWPTLVGAAASLVIVVGLAWQLQPMLHTRPSLGEQPSAAAAAVSSEAALPEDVLAAANPVAESAINSPPPPPAPTVAKAGRPRNAPLPAMAKAPSPPPTPGSAPSDFGDDAIPPYADYAGQATARQAASRAAANRAPAPAPTVERRERASGRSPEPFPAARADAADTAAMPASAPPQATQSSAPRPSGSVASPAPPAQKSAPTQPKTAAAEQDYGTLDRIEVTGSRLTMAELPVRYDARLDPPAWLQRIRDRRDGRDLDGARESLALFRRSHPRVRVPDDLAQLGR